MFPIENPNPVFRAAGDGLILFANQASAGLLAEWGTRVGGRLPAEWQEQVTATLAEGAHRRLAARCGDRVYELDLVPIPERGYANAYGRDVTEQEAARREREALLAELQREREVQQALMENTRTSLVYVDAQFNFVRMNAAYEVACQRPRSEMLGRNHFELFPDPENEAIFRQVLVTGEPVEFHAKPFEFADQPWRGVTYWDWTLTPYKRADGTVDGLFFSLVDVTEHVRAEKLSEAKNAIDAAISSQRDVAEMLRTLLEQAVAALGSDTGGLAVCEGEHWVLRYGVGLPEDVYGTTLNADRAPVTGRVVRERGIVAIADVGQEPGVNREEMARFGIGAVLMLPLMIRDEVTGVLSFNFRRPRPVFFAAELDFARKLAVSASLALENARILELESQQRRAAEERAAELAALLAVLPAGVGIAYDRACKDIRVNPALASMLAARPMANVSLSANERERDARYRVFDAAGRELTAEELPMQVAAARGVVVEDEVLDVLRADGVRLTLLCNAVPLMGGDGQPRGAVGVYADITERRAAEIERERLLGELQARTAELEARAGEFRALNASLERRVEERTVELEAILASIPDALIVGGESGIVRCNAAALRNFGCESFAELRARLPALMEQMQYRHADTGAPLAAAEQGLARALDGEHVVHDILVCHPATQEEQVYRVAAGPVILNGEIIGAVELATDITERKRMEAILRESEERYRLLYENSADGILLTTTDGSIQFANPAACRMYRRSEAEIRAGGRAALTDPTDPRWPASMAEREATGCFRGELSHRRGDGTTFPADVSSNVFRDRDGRLRTTTIVRDITERKRMEEELRAHQEQLKKLMHRLVELQERERREVANELYNDEGQRLTALLLDLVALEHEVREQGALRESVARAKALANGILADMHSLAVNLRPASLDRLGLIEGLRHFAEKLGKESGVSIEVEAGGLRRLPLAPDAETMLYRIAQEAVTNAVHHARARQVGVGIVRYGERLMLVIEDDGEGFDVAEVTRSGGMGLLAMRERAEMLGGRLTIESAPGKGTTVYIEAPGGDSSLVAARDPG